MKSQRRLFACSCLIALLSALAMGQQFGPWSAPVHIDSAPGQPGVNTVAYADLSPGISKDGLSLYLTRGNPSFCYPNCPADIGMYVSQRESLDQPWGAPQFVMDGSDSNLTLDGHRMYFSLGGDIYVTRRHNKRDAFGWQTPENLAAINSTSSEGSAFLFEDETTGITYLYFASNRTDLGGPGDMDIYVSTLQPDETWGPPALVTELSSPAFDNHPILRRDGLEIFFVSNRCGSLLNAQGKPSYDIWTSTRASSSEPWSAPVNIDADASGVTVCADMPPVKANVNSGRHDGKPSLSFDGTTLYFGAAQRPGNLGVGCPYAATCFFDLWMTTREKLRRAGADE